MADEIIKKPAAQVAVDGLASSLTEDGEAVVMTPAERTKLSGVEDNATADQTGAEIVTAIEGESGQNLVTDAEKAAVGNLPADTITELAGKATSAQGAKADSAVQADAANQFTAFQGSDKTQLTDAAIIGWDLAANQNAEVTLAGNRTFGAPTNLSVGYCVLTIIQDAAGSRTVDWDALFNFGEAGEPTLSTGANLEDMLQFYCNGSELRFIGILKGF